MGNLFGRLLFLTCCSLAAARCVTQQPASDIGDTITGPTAVSSTQQQRPNSPAPATPTPTAPTPTTPTPTTPAPTTPVPSTPVTVAYVQDLATIFQNDCVRCHSGSRPSANYSMSTYAQVMRAVSPGNPRSALVVTTQRNASMYRYWSGDAAGKAALVRSWVVDNGAAQQR
jgi:hypothetical protein